MSRVTSVKKNGTTGASYTYDDFGNLVGVSQGGASYSYTYGYTGNIEYISKTVNGVTTTKDLQYDDDGVWKDRLIAVDGAELVYSDTAPGLPTTYQNGNTYQMTWDDYGRLGMLYNSTVGINTYQYDTNGLRAFKRSKNVNHYYYYDGDRLIAETFGDKYFLFHYDETDSIFAITYKYTGGEYTYQLLKNLQGDVVAILNYNNDIIATYEYDPWGNLLSIKNENNVDITNSTGYFANINPIRYRGYYYDVETGFYYLKSRYYDPANARFISADSVLAVDSISNGTNLFAYCFNNPIMYVDNNGNWPEWGSFIKGTLAAAIGVMTVAAVVATGGTCVPLVALGYSVLGTAGTVMAVTGTSEVVESFTGQNAVKDYVGEETFETLQSASATVISFGPALIDAGANAVCFVGGTSIKTQSGLIPIEQVKVNDYVWASDPETGDVSLKQVVQTFVNESDELIHVFVNGEEIVTTPEHPFYSPVKGWTSAAHLRAGDILVLVNGSYVVVEKIQHEILESPITVYNFEVEDYHTYYVGNTSLLVHNACSNPGGRHGGSAHRNKVSSIKDDLSSKGWDVLPNEKRISVGNGRYRYPDVIATKNGQTRFYQVGRTTSAGRPVFREVRALRDLSGYADDIFFVPYD